MSQFCNIASLESVSSKIEQSSNTIIFYRSNIWNVWCICKLISLHHHMLVRLFLSIQLVVYKQSWSTLHFLSQSSKKGFFFEFSHKNSSQQHSSIFSVLLKQQVVFFETRAFFIIILFFLIFAVKCLLASTCFTSTSTLVFYTISRPLINFLPVHQALRLLLSSK